ncbi:hypothetical protein [Nocardia mangyaensis]|uniref:hypothetical protein n=1 Tax=Nocardia mangyaensis TaxID=2213200 RepID=UPI002676EE00|nr:hypothetical protein [Nocardia mangyaensis]MDO3646827.1 hypothetical protein [Nocardia mangyaensis]
MRSTTPHRGRITGVLLVLAVTLGLSGCGDDSGYQTQEPQPSEPTISQETVNDLCGILDAQKGTWKAIGPPVARVAFLGSVRLWTVRDGVAGAAIAYDPHIVDTVTERTCPEVRTATLVVLDQPDMKTAIAGF